MSSAIVVDRLSKTFPSSQRRGAPWALRDVTLRVAAGTIGVLTGRNGSGKTTLLKILATLILPTSGSARIHGADVVRHPLAVRRQLGVCLSDDRAAYWRLTGMQNLAFFGCWHGLSRRRIRERLAELAPYFPLEFLARPVYEYSAGMRQRLALVRAFLHDPPVLLLDEPTRSLDEETAQALRRYLARECARGKAILMATQRPAELAVGELLGRLEAGRLTMSPGAA